MKNKLIVGLAAILSAVTLRAADTTNTLLSFSDYANNMPSNIVANPTAAERKYSLLEKLSLTEGDWNEIANAHGTGSNLAFVVSYDKPVAFYKIDSAYEPIAPTNYPFQFTHDTSSAPQTFLLDIPVINYKTNNIDIVVDILVISNPYGLPYTSNMPFTNNIVPGTNVIHTSTTLPNCGYGKYIMGLISINKVDE